ncbi:GTP cyclohydrolase II [Paenibacillus phyllosphaerae]|uniref:GTP cyclohydrolase II n=1 Tax=Paenibacillus phyllosphaerae TaxID=274593 RepID=A0A7W5B069_9BACL|nr:GTP cyclohydrolase II [Paenibacillus phyllosphaerae]MBB3111276.1 GTP cyclohydrolase II [Paenibacillus phyllosphaerae]
MVTSQVHSILDHKIRLVPRDGKAIYLVGPINLPINLNGVTVPFQWYCWLLCDEVTYNAETMIEKLSNSNLAEKQQSSVLVYGDFEQAEEVLIRMHSICHTGDIFGSKRCDCGYQLNQALQMIVDHGAGALFYLANHEGRGIGLFSKAMAYVLQENGYDTVEANLNLGFVDDARSYADAIAVLQKLRAKPVQLITNNPRKIEALREAGMAVQERVPLWGDVSEYNEKYLQTKINRSGHLEEGCCND